MRRLGKFGITILVVYILYLGLYFVLMDRSAPAYRKTGDDDVLVFRSSFRWVEYHRSHGPLSFYVPGISFFNYLFYPADIAYFDLYQARVRTWFLPQ
jgi:hypothetical protein